MKKIYLILGGILIALITTSLIIILSTGKNEVSNTYKTENIYMLNYDNSERLDLGEYRVKDYQEPVREYGYHSHFHVESGEDFYNTIIKRNEYYNENLEFERDRYLAFGYMWKNLCLYHYEIKSDYVSIRPALGGSREYKNEDDSSDYIVYYVPGPLNYLIYEGEYEGSISEYDTNSSTTDDVTFNELVTIYSELASDFCKIEDDCIYLKGKYCYDYYDMELYVTEGYYCKITNNNGKAVIFKIKY